MQRRQEWPFFNVFERSGEMRYSSEKAEEQMQGEEVGIKM